MTTRRPNIPDTILNASTETAAGAARFLDLDLATRAPLNQGLMCECR